MRILILGGEGMLGHKMYQVLLSRSPDKYQNGKPVTEAVIYRTFHGSYNSSGCLVKTG